MYEIKINNKLDLDSTLFSGQAFRWYKKEDWYYGYINNVFLRIREKNNYIEYENSKKTIFESEIKNLADLATPILAQERSLLDALRVPLRSILSSPSFLYQAGESGDLNEHSLASRLSYFLWRSMPDQELLDLAEKGRLTEKQVLNEQVRRMLEDSKSQRFIKDFVGQAYRLNELKATSPDKGLYPEYDDRLGQAMQMETELFLAELISENLSLENLIDSDFTFLNQSFLNISY